MQTAACAAVSSFKKGYYAKNFTLYSEKTMRIAVFNQKGGVGKTTTAFNLAAAAHRHGQQPLVIDMDPQAHLSALHGSVRGGSKQSLFTFFQQQATLPSLEINWPGIGKLIPAHAALIKVDSILSDEPHIIRRLSQGLNDEAFKNDPVFMDCCPFLGVLSLNAMAAADLVLVPVSSDFMSLRGAQQISHTLNALEPVLKHRVNRRYVLTRFDRRRKMSADVQKKMVELFPGDVCETVISESAALADALAHNRDIFTHAADNRSAKDYTALWEELQS